MSLLILRHCFCLILGYMLYIFFYLLSSKFNLKPVFKSQTNLGFFNTPNRSARRFFTTGLYLHFNNFFFMSYI